MKADDQSMVYGSADPALTVTVPAGALESGEGLSGNLERAAGKDVGGYAITKGSLSAGGNYDLTVTPGALDDHQEGDHRDRRRPDQSRGGGRPSADLQGPEWLTRVGRQLQ